MLLLLVFSSIEIRTSESLLHEKLFGLNNSFRNFRSWSDFRYYNNSISLWTAALNIYLYGEDNPEWLKYIDTNGRINVSINVSIFQKNHTLMRLLKQKYIFTHTNLLDQDR